MKSKTIIWSGSKLDRDPITRPAITKEEARSACILFLSSIAQKKPEPDKKSK